MKILYAIQGTGNGHLARATEIIPHLQEIGETDILVSGIQGDINLPFKVKYKFYGLSFIFGKKGGIDFWQTILKVRPFELLRDIARFPVHDYDLILNDFEPVSAWACRLRGKHYAGISHQSAVLHPQAPKPFKKNVMAQFILKYYAPVQRSFGFHFKELDADHFTPVIRTSIRRALPTDKGHYTVYLPAFSDYEIIKLLDRFHQIEWQVFSKYCKKEYKKNNIWFSPVSLEGFNRSFINCKGVLCNAGFETPAEAIFMGKKLCVVPMKNQYEQACNAAMLAEIGVMVALRPAELHVKVQDWINTSKAIQITYPDQTANILQKLIYERNIQNPAPVYNWGNIFNHA